MASNHWKGPDSFFSMAPGSQAAPSRGLGSASSPSNSSYNRGGNSSPPSTMGHFGSSNNSTSNNFHQSSSFSNFGSASNNFGSASSNNFGSTSNNFGTSSSSNNFGSSSYNNRDRDANNRDTDRNNRDSGSSSSYNNRDRDGGNNSSNNSSNNSFFSSEMPPIGHFSASNMTSSASSSSNFDRPSFDRMGSGNRSSDNGPGQGSSSASSSTTATNGGFREAGIVEKLLPSYGFIQCCERQARLFFHYSQFTGNIEHLKLGDPVEFEMTYDRRTGKPIASYVIKIASEAIIGEEISLSGDANNMSGTVSAGFITTEPIGNKEGRVAYENRGECFFLPFTKDDLADPSILSTIKANDKVTFKIATDKSGNLRAKNIGLQSPFPDRYQGIVCTLKDSFGFIERSDVVKEIFFHSSECTDFKSLLLGDDVEFSIQNRNDKKVAVNVRRLPAGTVVFEEVSKERLTGQVIKLCDRYNSLAMRSQARENAYNNFGGRSASSDNFGTTRNEFGSSRNEFGSGNTNGGLLSPPNGSPPSSITSPSSPNGLIRYQSGSVEHELRFGDRDMDGEFTLQLHDWVTFNICTDKRDGKKKATRCQLHEDFNSLTGEPREQGYISALRDNYGFIKCFNSEGTRVYFRLTELVEPGVVLQQNDEVEFTAQVDNTSLPPRVQAIRIKTLPNGTILNNLLNPRNSNSSNSIGFDRTIGSNGANCSAQAGSGNSGGGGRYSEGLLIDLSDEDINGLNSGGKKQGANEGAGAFAGSAVMRDSWIDILSQMPITVQTAAGVTAAVVAAASARRIDQRSDQYVSRIKLKAPSCGSEIAKIVLVRQPRAPDGTKGFILARCSASP